MITLSPFTPKEYKKSQSNFRSDYDSNPESPMIPASMPFRRWSVTSTVVWSCGVTLCGSVLPIELSDLCEPSQKFLRVFVEDKSFILIYISLFTDLEK